MAGDNYNYVDKNIAIIGSANSGPVLEPIETLDKQHATSVFESGDIVKSYNNLIDSSNNMFTNNIYLVRIKEIDSFDKFQQYKDSYESLEAYDIDIFLPTNFSFKDFVYEYPKPFYREEVLDVVPYQSEYKLNNDIEDIKYISINDNYIRDYEVIEDYTIKLDFVPTKSSKMVVKYYTVPIISLNYIIYVYLDGEKYKTLEKTFDFNTKNGKLQSTDKTIREIVGINKPNLKFDVSIENPYVDIYTSSHGFDSINFFFHKKEYVNKRIKESYYIKELGKACIKNNSIAFVHLDQNTEINEVKKIRQTILNNYDTELGKMIVPTPTIFDYGDNVDSGISALAALANTRSCHESLTNESIPGHISLYNEINKHDDYASEGVVTFVQTTRNGLAPHKAVTLASYNNPYRYLKTTRIINELSKRISYICDNFIGGSVEYAMDELPDLINEVINNMVREEKILDARFSINQVSRMSLEIKLSVSLEGEISKVTSSLISHIE